MTPDSGGFKSPSISWLYRCRFFRQTRQSDESWQNRIRTFCLMNIAEDFDFDLCRPPVGTSTGLSRNPKPSPLGEGRSFVCGEISFGVMFPQAITK